MFGPILQTAVKCVVLFFLLLVTFPLILEMLSLKIPLLSSTIGPLQEQFNLSKEYITNCFSYRPLQAEERFKPNTSEDKPSITPEQFVRVNVNGLSLVQVALEQDDIIDLEAMSWIEPNLELCATEIIKIQGSSSIAEELTSVKNHMSHLLKPMIEVNALQKRAVQRLVFLSKDFASRYKKEDDDTLSALQALLHHLSQSWTVQLEKIDFLVREFELMKKRMTAVTHRTAKERSESSFYQIFKKWNLNRVIDSLLDTSVKIQHQQQSLKKKEQELLDLLENTAFSAQFIQHYHVVTDSVLKIESTIAHLES